MADKGQATVQQLPMKVSFAAQHSVESSASAEHAKEKKLLNTAANSYRATKSHLQAGE